MANRRSIDVDDQDNDAAVGLFAILVIVLCAWCCCPKFCRNWCCCGRCCGSSKKSTSKEKEKANKKKKVTVDGQHIDVEYLKRKKSTSIAYLLWGFGGVVGAHLFYLDRLIHAALAAVSLNFFLIGYICDFFFIPVYTSGFNKRTSDSALPEARGCCSFYCRALLVVVITITMWTEIVKAPDRLDTLRWVDLERERAGTDGNPYEILGVPRGSSFQEIRLKHEAKLRRQTSKSGSLRPERSSLEKEEIKAFDYFKDKDKKERQPSERAKKKKKKNEDDDNFDFDKYIAEVGDKWKAMFRIGCRRFGVKEAYMNTFWDAAFGGKDHDDSEL